MDEASNDFFFIFGLAAIMAVIAVLAWLWFRDRESQELPKWAISEWSIDGQGDWLQQPVLSINNDHFRFSTPWGYVWKLRKLRSKMIRLPHANVEPIDSAIRQLEQARLSFGTRPVSSRASPTRPIPSSPERATTAHTKTDTQHTQSHPSAILSQSNSAAAPLGMPESKLVRQFSDRLGESGRVPFANAFRALYTLNGSAFPYWLDAILARGVDDAYTSVAAQYRAVWSHSVLVHYKLCLEFAVSVPQDILREVAEAIRSVEILFSFDRLATVGRVAIDVRFRLPDDPLNDLSYEIDQFRRGGYKINSDSEYDREKLLNIQTTLLNGRFESLLNWTAQRLLCEPGAEIPVELPIGDLAGWLAVLASMHKRDAPAQARTFANAALVCAARAHPDAMDYPNMLAPLRAAGLTVPAASPQPRATTEWAITLDGELLPSVASVTPLSVPATANEPRASPVPRSEADIARGIDKSLIGLVGLEALKSLLAMDIYEFLSARQSRGRVFWGSSGVGKTELAQRLAGLREGLPPLSIGGGEIRYVSGVDGRLGVKEVVDDIRPLSILFIDEADKCLDPKAGMVSESEATQARHAIITHFQRKPVLWVFVGVFAQMRNDGQITDDALRSTFGDELAHRLDYADWGFPAWTLENLLKAVNGGTSRRKLAYDDDAALFLAQYCIKSGGGVRAFDNLETAIIRHQRVSGQPIGTKVSLIVAQQILAKRGVQSV